LGLKLCPLTGGACASRHRSITPPHLAPVRFTFEKVLCLRESIQFFHWCPPFCKKGSVSDDAPRRLTTLECSCHSFPRYPSTRLKSCLHAFFPWLPAVPPRSFSPFTLVSGWCLWLGPFFFSGTDVVLVRSCPVFCSPSMTPASGFFFSFHSPLFCLGFISDDFLWNNHLSSIGMFYVFDRRPPCPGPPQVVPPPAFLVPSPSFFLLDPLSPVE